MDNTQASSLSELIDTYDFFENPLDVYESYTYTLEWFVVDRDADRRFQEFGESIDVSSVVRDAWPGPEDVKITIAKTGVTSEFNIADLTVEAQGAGMAESSKLAGTATYLEFSIVEVGETSLNDNLQNAIALCGWRGVDSAHYYMKINFIGVKTDGSTVKLPQTKVLTFTLQKVTRLSSTTDARGTSTVLQGTILNDTVIGNNAPLSKTEGSFTYLVGDNLSDTLGATEDVNGEPKEGSFIDELNKNTKRRHPTLLDNLQNTYKVTMSGQFKEFIKDSPMSGVTANTITSISNVHKDVQVGQVQPLMSIFSIIDDIVLNTLKVKQELIEDSPKRTKVHKIIPWIVPKENGWNAITGTQAYDVEFFIDFDKRLVIQNALDDTVKTAQFGETFKELLEESHVNKIYHYLFTGKNDQILDFNITLDQYLAKTYSVPSDWYAYENIVKAETVEGNALLESYKEFLNSSEKDTKELSELMMKAEQSYFDSQKKLQNYDDTTFKSSLENAYSSIIGGSPGDFSDSNRKKQVDEFFKGKTIEQVQAEILEMQGEDGSSSLLSNIEEREKLKESIETTRQNFAKTNNEYTAQRDGLDANYKDYIASLTSVNGEVKWNNGIKQNAQRLLTSQKERNFKNLILLEELDNDMLSQLSNEDFENILRSQANNPTVYSSVLRQMADPNFVPTIKSTDPENIALARAKYYEAKGASVSMINATMVIKGDPHWLEGYIPPKVLKEEFGDVGAISDKGYSMLTSINGYNYLILKSGKADGTDLYDNVLKTDMLTHLYAVTNITSSFSGGLFTQTLQMTRETRFDTVTSFTPTVGPELQERDDINDNKQTIDEQNRIADEKLIAIARGVEEEIEASKQRASQEIETLQNNIGMNNNGSLFVTNPDGSITVLTGPLDGEVDRKMKSTVNSATDELENTIDILSANANNPTGNLGYHSSISLDNITRRNNALFTLENWADLGKACASGKSPGSCTALETTRNGILATVGLTAEDRGTPEAVTTINDYFNTALADPNTTSGFAISEQEVAMYQIAVGADLNVTGHNSSDIKKITDNINLDRTVEEIIAEVETDTYGSKPMGFAAAAAVDATSENKLLNGEKPLVNGDADGQLINIPTYTWSEKLYRDQINYPNSNNDWKTTHWFEEHVDNTVATEKVFNTETRRLEVKPIVADSLIIGEASDVQILTDKYNRIMNDAYLNASGAHQAKEQEWLDNTVDALDNKITEEEIVVSDDVRKAMNFRAAAQIRAASTVELLDDVEFAELESTANAINHIVDHTVTDDRGDISDALKVGELQGELLTSKLKQDDLYSNTYYFDPSQRTIDAISLEELETESAIAELSLPNEVTTSVAVTSNSGNAEKVSIKNPVEQNDVEHTPILVSTDASLNTRDIVLPGSLKEKLEGAGVGFDYAMANPDKVAQYNEALKIYKAITDFENGPTVEVADDNGIMHTVKDYNNIPPIIYTDANGVSQTISDPSNFFGVYTMTYNDMNPIYLGDYDAIKGKVADLFPDIKSGQESQNVDGKINTKNGAPLTITIKADKFFIDATTP